MMYPTIYLDWMTVNLNIPQGMRIGDGIRFSTEEYRFELQEIGTKIFEKRFFIYKSNEKVATFLHTPKSPIIHPNLSQLTISNKMLYTTDVNRLVGDVCNCIKGWPISLSRVDIAMDCERFESEEAQTFVSMFLNNEILRLSRQKGYSSFYSKNNKLNFTGISWVSKGASNSWKVYNKSQEMRDNDNHKRYIREIWKKNGWKGEKDVWRIELSMKNFSKQAMIDEKTSRILNTTVKSVLDDAIYIFIYQMQRTFKFCYNDGNKNVSRNRKFVFFDAPELKYQQFYETPGVKDETRKIKMVASELFLQITRQTREELAHCMELYDTLLYFIREYGLQDYFEFKFNIDIELLELDRNFMEGKYVKKDFPELCDNGIEL